MTREVLEGMNVGGNAAMCLGLGYLIREMRQIKRAIQTCPVCSKKSKVKLDGPMIALGVWLIFAGLGVGCVRVSYRATDGAEFKHSRPAFGKVTIGKLDVERGTNRIRLEGYQGDTVEASRAIAEGVAAGLTRAVKP